MIADFGSTGRQLLCPFVDCGYFDYFDYFGS